MAAAQSSRQKMFGYKRAASAVFWLDRPLSPATLTQKVPGLGPASMRIIGEFLATGTSATVERAVAAVSTPSARADIDRRRTLRGNFLSRAAVLDVLARPGDGTVAPADYGGDFQMHSEWSDGSSSIAALADACVERGYRFMAVTDHAQGLPIAGGLSMARVRSQHREIARLNRARPSFHIFKGIEANIAADGSIDVSVDEAGEFDIILAAPHSKLRKAEDQTARLLRAIESPAHILAHPRGRISSTRAGVAADWDRVFAHAARHGVAVELDGDPSRQDLDYDLARRALAAGCLFALDSDAHGPSQLLFTETAIAHARLAGIPRDRIVNCWTLSEVQRWLGQMRAPRAS